MLSEVPLVVMKNETLKHESTYMAQLMKGDLRRDCNQTIQEKCTI